MFANGKVKDTSAWALFTKRAIVLLTLGTGVMQGVARGQIASICLQIEC